MENIKGKIKLLQIGNISLSLYVNPLICVNLPLHKSLYKRIVLKRYLPKTFHIYRRVKVFKFARYKDLGDEGNLLVIMAVGV